jgi:hypothetical protein
MSKPKELENFRKLIKCFNMHYLSGYKYSLVYTTLTLHRIVSTKSKKKVN